MTQMKNVSEAELSRIWDMVFNLALNFLHDESAAEEATQEVFVKASEAFASFRGEAALGTWIYRIAHNHLVDARRAVFIEPISFEIFERDVSDFAPYENELGLTEAETSLYVDEIKVGCTKAMLQCLDAEDRFAYILGKLFALPGRECAAITGVSEESFRQRLSRAARKVGNFMKGNCGLVNENATCHCRKRIKIAVDRGRIRTDILERRDPPRRIRDYLAGMNELDTVAEVFRENPFIERSRLHADDIRRAVARMERAVI